jgi:hypothetical protein
VSGACPDQMAVVTVVQTASQHNITVLLVTLRSRAKPVSIVSQDGVQEPK